MSDHLNIGPTPDEEECAQVGIDPNYDSASKRECAVYRRMLERLFPIPEGCCAYFAIQSFPHNFGFYREVCVRYNPENADECEFAYRVEAQSPAQWDAIARSELDGYEQCDRAHEPGHHVEHTASALSGPANRREGLIDKGKKAVL